MHISRRGYISSQIRNLRSTSVLSLIYESVQSLFSRNRRRCLQKSFENAVWSHVTIMFNETPAIP